MSKTWLQIGFLIAAAIGLFYFSNYKLEGYLRSPATLAKELKSPPDSVYQYRLANEAPFKYRLLFSGIVKGSYKLVAPSHDTGLFFQTYRFWSIVFYTFSVVLMFWLLQVVGFPGIYAFYGALIFLLLPPMLMAFTLPVHTRDDTLAYAILFLGLIALSQERKMLFLLIAMVGVTARETLLLLPLLYIVFARDKNPIRKLTISGLPVLLWILIRFIPPSQGYDAGEGLRWNLANLPQVLGFLIIAFNVCWFSFIAYAGNYRSHISASAGTSLEFFYRSAPFVLAVIVITTFLGGIFNEIRLLYLACPWMIVLFLDFVRNNSDHIKVSLRKQWYWLYATGVLIICPIVTVFLLRHQESILGNSRWMVPYDVWIIVSMGYVAAMLLFAPFMLRRTQRGLG